MNKNDTWEMINFLVWLHSSKKLLADVTIDPAEIKIQIAGWFSNEIPFKLFWDMFNNRVLCLYNRKWNTSYVDYNFGFFSGLMLWVLLTARIVSLIKGVFEFLHNIS